MVFLMNCKDLYAEADIGGGSGGLGSVNEVLIHEKHTTDDDLLIEATVSNFQYQGSISTRSMQLVRIKNYKVELMLKPFHIFKGGWSDNDIEEHHLLVASLTEYVSIVRRRTKSKKMYLTYMC